MVLAVLVLVPRRTAGRPALLAGIALLILLLHGAEIFWLVTPGFRGAFKFTWADALALVGVWWASPAASTARSIAACGGRSREPASPGPAPSPCSRPSSRRQASCGSPA